MKRKQTKLQKLRAEVKRLRDNAEYWKKEYDDIRTELTSYKEGTQDILKQFESKESDQREQVRWLRELLELVVVEKGKMPELAKIIEERRQLPYR